MGAGTGPPGHREASTARMTMKQRGRLHAKTAWDKAAGEAQRHDAQRRNQQGSPALFPRQ